MGTYINKPKRNYNKKREQNDLDRKNRQKVYQSKMWEELRKAKNMENPICQVCEMINKVNLTQEIHHLRSFTKYVGNERDAVAYNYNNLIALCKYHHYLFHHGYLQGATTLEEIEERVKKNEDKENEDE